jgi:DNA polymerase-3 subunit epsilon
MNNTLKAVIVEVTAGNVRNHHINLNGTLGLFPDDAVGGSNKASCGAQITLLIGADAVQTDVDGTKGIFREGAAIRRFFAEEGVEEGDLLLIERRGERTYGLSKTSKRAFKYHL